MSSTSPKWIFADDEWLPADKPLVCVESRAVSYGDGCFETMRSYSGKILHLDRHLERLRRGMEYLGITPPKSLKYRALRETVSALLKRNGMNGADGVIRIQVWREGDRGFRIPGNARTRYAVTVSPMPDIPESVKLAPVPTRRIPAEALNPEFKLSNSINYIRAADEAAQSGAEDALMLTVGGAVSETTIANIFWLKGRTAYTPSRNCDLLPGITREILMEIIQDNTDLTLERGDYPVEHLLESETVWICNSVRETVPVRSVDEREFNTAHPEYRAIENLYKSYVTKMLD